MDDLHKEFENAVIEYLEDVGVEVDEDNLEFKERLDKLWQDLGGIL